MNRSKPSTVDGGGEMKRDTSSVVSAAYSAGASLTRSSRSVTSEPVSSGSPVRQSFRVDRRFDGRHRRDDSLAGGRERHLLH